MPKKNGKGETQAPPPQKEKGTYHFTTRLNKISQVLDNLEKEMNLESTKPVRVKEINVTLYGLDQEVQWIEGKVKEVKNGTA